LAALRVQIKKVFKTTLQKKNELHLIINLKDFMTKNFQQVEDVMTDESFLAWYFRESDSGVAAWENWLAANPGQQALVHQAVVLMGQLSQKQATVSDEEVETKLLQLHERIGETATPVVRMNTSRKRWWIGVAAAVLLVVGGFTFFKLSQSKHQLDAAYGEICSKQLPDGSTMILNANSNAKLSDGWEDGKDREVWLDGEAFFKVTKTPQKSRFIVHTGQLDVIVTGTQFNVMHRDNKTTVLLTEGSVILRTTDGKELAMKPGDYVEMQDNMVARKEAKEESVLAWKENKMAFENTPMSEAAKLISNHYGVKVTITDDKAMQEKLNGVMSNNNLDVLLQAIELVKNVRIQKRENEIIISSITK
jgi:ferric-dicitrate binding protein FerR (iron transport regulator)